MTMIKRLNSFSSFPNYACALRLDVVLDVSKSNKIKYTLLYMPQNLLMLVTKLKNNIEVWIFTLHPTQRSTQPTLWNSFLWNIFINSNFYLCSACCKKSQKSIQLLTRKLRHESPRKHITISYYAGSHMSLKLK